MVLMSDFLASPPLGSVIFLDVDGVVLPFGPGLNEDHADLFPLPCLEALNSIVEASGATIVLSSTWRCMPVRSERCC
jgi:hypothetical protein